MVRKAILFGLLVGAASCAPNPGPLYINAFYSMDVSTSCSSPGELIPVRAGFLNIAGSPDYWAAVELKGADSILTTKVTGGTGTVLEPENRERVIIDRELLTYEATGVTGTLAPEEVAFSWVLGFGDNVTPINVIGPKASAALGAGAVQPSTEFEASGRLRVGVELVGHTTGSNAIVRTGSVPIEIWLFNTPDDTCPNAQYARDSQCFSTGQNTMVRPACCAPGGTPVVPSPYGCP